MAFNEIIWLRAESSWPMADNYCFAAIRRISLACDQKPAEIR